MKNNRYQLYVNSVLQLASTIVIKSTESADTINRMLTQEGLNPTAVDPLDKTSWKYYRHLAGEYHPTDSPMTVISLDTLENILFSKETLAIHRATARGYAYGTRQYQELIARYPGQEQLILGILYPVDVEKAIAAPNGKILGYPPGYVEENEYNLITKLQQWIDGYLVRWVNIQYGVSDSLYSAVYHGIMYLNLVPAILTLRLSACKTNEAHSFHVRQYLNSYGLLDKYIDMMTTRQRLFFYRNIAYLRKNAGQQGIFHWLVEHVMTERHLPLAEYTMRHDVSKQPTDIYPELAFHKKSVNGLESLDFVTQIDLRTLLFKQLKTARDNGTYRDEHEVAIKEQMENSLSNVVLTKTLESSVTDYSNSSPYSIEEILHYHWLYWASTGQYTAVISAVNPKSGSRMPMTVKDAYTLAWYCLCRSVGIDIVTIPTLLAKRVLRPLLTIEEMASLVEARLVPQSLIDSVFAARPIVSEMISIESFYTNCQAIYQMSELQRRVVGAQEHPHARAQVHVMMSRNYADLTIELEPEGTTYDSWLAEQNITLDNLTEDDYALLYKSIVEEATGVALNTSSSLRDLQKSMVGLLTHLSSYSVQVISDINDTRITQTDWPIVRVGDVGAQTSSQYYDGDGIVGVIGYQQRSKASVNLPIMSEHASFNQSVKTVGKMEFKLNTAITQSRMADRHFAKIDAVSVRVKPYPELLPRTDGIIPVSGIESFDALSDTQKTQLRDIYSGNYFGAEWRPVPAPIDPSTLYMTDGYVDPGYVD